MYKQRYALVVNDVDLCNIRFKACMVLCDVIFMFWVTSLCVNLSWGFISPTTLFSQHQNKQSVDIWKALSYIIKAHLKKEKNVIHRSRRRSVLSVLYNNNRVTAQYAIALCTSSNIVHLLFNNLLYNYLLVTLHGLTVTLRALRCFHCLDCPESKSKDSRSCTNG